MDDKEFDQVSEILFNGVPSILKIGLPGVLIPLSKETRAVLCGDNSFNVIIVAVRFGQGRCLIFAHNGYLNFFKDSKEANDHAQFVKNCKQWISKGTSNEILNIGSINSMNETNVEGKILVWDGHSSKDDEFMNDLVCDLMISDLIK